MHIAINVYAIIQMLKWCKTQLGLENTNYILMFRILKSYKNIINLQSTTLWENMTELTKYVGTPDINKAEMIQKRLL